MPFTVNLGFATEHDREAFTERILPKLRGQQVEPQTAEGMENDGLHRIAVAVTSQSAAKDICHQVVAFLAHTKGLRVNLSWLGADGSVQAGEVDAGEARQAEVLALRIGAAAKARLDADKTSA